MPFDADLEYAPADLTALMAPIVSGRADVVYGPRMFGVNTRYQSFRHAMGNRVLTLTANLLFDSYLSDMHTCLKVLPAALFADLTLSENGFGLDTEITAKLLKVGIRPFEVPVSYYSRSVAEGKKITWRDGVECLEVMGRVRWAWGRRSTPAAARPADGLRAAQEPVSSSGVVMEWPTGSPLSASGCDDSSPRDERALSHAPRILGRAGASAETPGSSGPSGGRCQDWSKSGPVAPIENMSHPASLRC